MSRGVCEARYLLCRPRGGLNDTLSRIERCWRFAERTDRHLVIDTSRSGLHGAFDDFFTVVGPSIPMTVAPDPELLAHLNTLPCRPTQLAGRLDRYHAEFVRGAGFVDSERGVPARFGSRELGPREADCPELLLVYEDSGGGTDSCDFLARVRFSDAMAVRFRAMLERLGDRYVAVHVRNTDYRTDFRRLFAKIRGRVGGSPILVCSDDPEVVEYARRVFDGPVLGSTGRAVSSNPTGAVHLPNSYGDVAMLRQAAIDALGDLVLLANARTLFIGPVAAIIKGEVLRGTGIVEYRPVPAGTLSGYSLLARHLCTRKDRLDGLLGVPPERRRPADAADAVTVMGLECRVRLFTRRALARLRGIRPGGLRVIA